VALVICACLTLLGATAAPAVAQGSGASKSRQAEIERQIKTLRGEVAEASAEEAALLGKIDAVRQRRQALDTEVAAIDARIRTTEGELGVAEANLRRVERDLKTTQAKLKATEERLAGARNDLRDRAVAAYVGQPKSAVAGVALGAKSLRELSALRIYYRTIVQDQQERIDRYRGVRAEIDDLREQLEVSRAKASSDRDRISETKTSLEASKQSRARLSREVAAQEVKHQELLGEIKGRISEFESKIKTLRRESDSIAARLRAIQAGRGKTTVGRGVIAHPIPGARITSPYGSRTHPIFLTPRLHTGIDYGASSGTSIRAAGDGKVIFASSYGGYGNATIIDHGGSLATLYAHQSSMLVKVGQRVTKGQVIGRVGSTGFSTGPHLHFEVRVSGTPVDPMRYL
jgi:murein DD-endopeptidase MepM/ murein hydrolase activator NlpD